jgi:hypothetical protein
MQGRRARGHPVFGGNQLEAWLNSLQQDLLRGEVEVGRFRSFVIHDPKRRVIHAAPFRERVLHHAIMNVAGPVFERLGIDDSFIKESLRGRGYVRYMDDLVLWHDSEEVLGGWHRSIAEFLSGELRLELKPGSLLGRSRDGVSFIGARVTPWAIYPDRRARRRLVRKLRAVEDDYRQGRLGPAELQTRATALLAAVAHTRSAAWRRARLIAESPDA